MLARYAGASPDAGTRNLPANGESPPDEEQRPGSSTGAPPESSRLITGTVIVAADEDRTQARCDVCGHHLHKPSSVAARRGPVCAGRVVDLDELEAVRHG